MAQRLHEMACDRNGYYDVPDGKIASVVTYLEMTAPPPGSAPPEREDLTLRPVAEADPGWYRDLYRRIGDEWLWFSRLHQDDRALTEILHDPAVEVFALVHETRDAGLLELDRRDPDNVELAFFGVVPELIGHGAGHWLMAMAIALAFGPGPRRFWLHTCSLDHPRALAFYRRAGFVPYKRAIEIADDPRLNGLLPADTGPNVPLIED